MNQKKLWRLIAGVGLALTSVLFVLLLLSQNTAGATRDRPNETDDIVLTPRHSVSHPDAGARAGALAVPYTVFTPLDITSTNLLTNPGFEDDPAGIGWTNYYSGYLIDEEITHTGARSLKLVSQAVTERHGASQIITFDPPIARPLYFSGWSKAECVSGNSDSNYSVYLDVYYTDAPPSYGYVLEFAPCSPDWQFRESIIMPEAIPEASIVEVHFHCLLRDTHRGTVWFDDLSLREVQSDIVFDSVPVTTTPPSPPPYGGEALTLETGDGLAVALAAEGGVITSVVVDGTPVHDPDHAYASGFFVRDVNDVVSKTSFMQVGGQLVQAEETTTHTTIAHTSTMTELDLDFGATYTATADRITIHAQVTDTSESTRALTLYFALPISATEDWTWGDDNRTSRTISGVLEFANFSNEHRGIGANGHLSKYPWASLSGPPGGIALGVPLDSPRAMRLIHNPITNQFYAAFDLGLYPFKFVYLPIVMRNGESHHQIGSTRRFLPPYGGHAPRFPNRGSVDLVLYRFDNDWDFRAAAQGYYDRFPKAFTRRVPCEREGIWVAFSDVEPITDVEDFGIAFHELGCLNQIPFDDERGILSFRYLAEPWSHWLPINDLNVDPYSYTQVITYLQEQYEQERELLTNPGFEEGSEVTATGWYSFTLGPDVYTYTVDPTGGRDGGRAIRLHNAASDETHGALQTLTRHIPRPIYFSGWSRAENLTGTPDSNYSIYLDVYTEDGPIWEQVIQFDTHTDTWQFREGFVIPAKPIYAINVHCLLRDTHSGTVWFDDLSLREVGSESERAEATLSSGFFDTCGRYRYEPYRAGEIPWCNDTAGCAVFTVNPDPDISVPPYRLNKAHLEWNQAARETYTATMPGSDGDFPGLDGEYIDSFLGHATAMDSRTAHFAAADIPLAYRTSDRRVGVPEVFATVEFARWVAQDVHEDLGKWMMANWILRDLPWGADLFDVMGTETNWLSDGSLVPESDEILNYRRTLAYQRPYGLLMNTNFDNLTHDLVEDYFQISLFYGLYPSMFSHNAAEDPYWEDRSLYNRDRDLFKRYVPLIRRLNCAGWQPVTYATTSKPEDVFIERYGEWPDLYFTVRNNITDTVPVTVTLWAGNDDLGLPSTTLTATALLAEIRYPLSGTGDIRTLTITLDGQAREVLHLGLDTEQQAFRPQRSAPDRSPYALEPCKDHGVLSTSGK